MLYLSFVECSPKIPNHRLIRLMHLGIYLLEFDPENTPEEDIGEIDYFIYYT
jgi:hypothetical protein